jgi:hypothetical protein
MTATPKASPPIIAAALAAIVSIPALAQMASPSAQEWGLVLGGNRSATLAAQEVAVNNRILGQKPRLYLCNGWYRTVAPFRSKREALLALQKVLDAGSKRAPYIISISQWCPSKKLVASP